MVSRFCKMLDCLTGVRFDRETAALVTAGLAAAERVSDPEGNRPDEDTDDAGKDEDRDHSLFHRLSPTRERHCLILPQRRSAAPQGLSSPKRLPEPFRAIFKYSSETYDPHEWMFPGSEHLDGTINGALKASTAAYPP